MYQLFSSRVSFCFYVGRVIMRVWRRHREVLISSLKDTLYACGFLTVPSKIMLGIIPGIPSLVNIFPTTFQKEGPTSLTSPPVTLFTHHAPATFSLFPNTQSSFLPLASLCLDGCPYSFHDLLSLIMQVSAHKRGLPQSSNPSSLK